MAIALTQTTRNEVEHILTEHGVIQATLEELGSGDAIVKVLNDAEERAEVKLNAFLSDYYDLVENTTSNYLKWAKAVFWAVSLARRFGVESDGLRLEYEEFVGHLTMVRSGSAKIPDGIPRKESGGATMTNLELDRRFRTSRIRAVLAVSAGDQDSDEQRKASHLIEYDL